LYILFIIFLLSYVLGRLDTTNYFIDIFDQLSFQVLLGGIILFFILIFSKKLKTSVACILICFLLAADILPTCKHCNAFLKNQTQNDNKIRIMTFNTGYESDDNLPKWYLGLEKLIIKNKSSGLNDIKNLETLKKVILFENPDIVHFLEITQEFKDKIKSFESIFPYNYLIQYKFPGIADSIFISKYPFKKNNNTKNHSGIAKIIVNETELNILSVHLYSALNQNRFKIVDKQIQIIKNLIENTNQNLILIGDFNMTPISKRFINFLEDTNLYTYTSFVHPTSTWPAILPNFLGIQIDHVLFSENFKMIMKKTTKNLGSDHRALIVDLVF